MTIEVSEAENTVECRADARLVARSAAFYLARSRNPRQRLVRFGRTPNAPSMLSGLGYTGNVRVPGSGTLEVGETRCSNGRVDRRCAGVFRAALQVQQFFTATSAETRQTSLLWAHNPPKPPTPLPSQVCLSGDDETAVRITATAMAIFFKHGFTGHYVDAHSVPLPHASLLTKRTFTTRGQKGDTTPLPAYSSGTARTTATFTRVR